MKPTLAAVVLAPLLVGAQNISLPNINMTIAQCVDPAGFTQCWDNATATAQACVKAEKACASNTTNLHTNEACAKTCGCPFHGSAINCALVHCWNEVYTCEYQHLAIAAVANCPGAGRGSLNTATSDGYIPFVPAPAGAPGPTCSCDISYVLYHEQVAEKHGDTCAANAGSNATAATACKCCAASEAVSAFYNTCADTNPQAVPLWAETLGKQLDVLQSNECTALFDKSGAGVKSICSAMGFAKPGINGGEFYSGKTLPANGAANLTDVAGNGTISSPLAGPTLVWRLGGDDRFLNMTAVAVTASATATGTATGTGTAGNGSVSSTATPNSSTGGAGVERFVAVFAGVVALVASSL